MNFIDAVAIPLLGIVLQTIIILYILWNMPWITRYWKPKIYRYVIRDAKRVMVISDIHLWGMHRAIDIGRMAREKNIDSVIVAGDLIDEIVDVSSYRTIVEILKRAVDDMDLHNTMFIFIPSRSFHDFRAVFRKPISFTYRDVVIHVIPDVAMFRIDGCNEHIVVTHGDYAFRSGVIAFLLDVIGKRFGILLTGELLRKIYSLDRNTWFIYGHSHIGYIDYGRKTINTGCWKPMELLKIIKIDSIIRGVTIHCNNGYLEIVPNIVR